MSNLYKEYMKNSFDNIVGIDQLRGKNIFVTGSTGLIGSVVIEMLSEMNRDYGLGMEIIAGARNEIEAERMFSGFSSKITICKYSAEEGFPQIKVDYIIHCVGNATPDKYVKFPCETMNITVNSIQHILRYSTKHKVIKIVFVSSSEVYGITAGMKPIEENEFGYIDLSDIRSDYGVAKRYAEMLCLAYCVEHNVPVTIARPGHIYGHTFKEYDKRVYAMFARCCQEKRDIVLKSDGSSVRSYCHVIDCASAILTIMLSGEIGQAYNIADDIQTTSIVELANCFAKHGGISVKFDIPVESERKQFNAMSFSALDGKKLKELGWKASLSVDDGVACILECLEKRGERQ